MTIYREKNKYLTIIIIGITASIEKKFPLALLYSQIFNMQECFLTPDIFLF